MADDDCRMFATQGGGELESWLEHMRSGVGHV